MTIRTNFTNLKGNTIRLVSATEGSGAGDDTTVIIGEYISGTTDLFQAPAGTCTIDGNDTTTTENQCLDLSGTWVVAVDGSVLDATRTFNVQGGKRGVKFFSGSSVPVSVIGSQLGDLYLDISITEPNRSKLYEKMTQSNPGLATDWQERADLTGAQGFSISASATSNTGLGESNTLTISNTDSAVADVDISINSGTTGSAGAGFAIYADNTLYPIGSTVIFNNTQWRALVEVPVTNTDDPAEGDDWSEISTLSQDQFVTSIDDLSDVDTTTTAPVDGDTLVWTTDEWIPGTPESSGATLYKITGVAGEQSVLDIVLSGAWTSAIQNGIQISGFTSTVTDDAARVELDLRYDNTVGTFRGDGGGAQTHTRLFTTTARATDAQTFIADMVVIFNAPRTGSVVIFPATPADRPEDDYFNFTASQPTTNTLRLVSDGVADWAGITVTVDGSGVGMTLQTGYDSHTLVGNADTLLPEADVTYTQGQIVFHPSTSPEGYMQLSDGSITTTADAAELPTSVTSPWKQIT